MTRLQIRACAAIVLLAIATGCVRSPEARRDEYLARGKALLQKHDYSRAILEFRNAVKAMPKDAEPYYQIGVASEDAGDIRTAVAFFRKAVEQNPRHTGAQLKLAQLMAGATEKTWLKGAEARLNALKQSAPTSPDVLNSLALTELKLGETGEAVKNLQQSLASAPTELRSSILLAQTKLWQHDMKRAEEVLLRACESAPNSPDARVALGEFYVIEKKAPEAEKEFQRALVIDPKSGPALMHLANLQRSLARNREAEQTFERLAASGQDRYKPVHAQFLFEEGRRDDAIREFERLAKESPGDRLARTRLIAAYQSVNRTADAQKVLDEALRKNPRDLDALLQRAEIFVDTTKYGQAEADLNRALHLRPNSGDAHYIRATLYQKRGESLSYRQELSESLRLDSYLVPVRLELAQSLIADKQPAAALETLDAAPPGQKQLVPIIIERNWALWVSGDMAQMRKGIDQGLARERSADLLVQDGLWKLKSGNPSAARASLEEALKTNPADIRALSALNTSYLALKQADMAMKAVKDYAAREPNSAPVQEFWGAMLSAHGEHSQARSAFEAAKAADPRFIPADFSLAQIDAHEGKWDAAAGRMRAVLSRDDRVITAHLWLADIDSAKGNYDAAIHEYQQVVDITPNDPRALNNLAYLLTEYRKQPDAALKLAQRAVELAPDDPNFLDTLGWILYEKSLYPSAIPYLERAAAKGDNAALKYHLAMAYAKAGASTRARETLALALKSDPNAPEAKSAAAVVARQN